MARISSSRRLAEAAEAFNAHEGRKDGAAVVESLNAGLNLLCDTLYYRVHQDVEKLVGKDSMLMPLSEVKNRQATEKEIEIYQVAEAAATMTYLGHVEKGDDWHVEWLGRLRLGEEAAEEETARRLADYLARKADDRRLAFTDVLAEVLAESRRAPLVLFRLLPLSVRIAAALAFGNAEAASDFRARQIEHLPAISDCQSCHGKILENGRQCPDCGNPLWKSQWLVAD